MSFIKAAKVFLFQTSTPVFGPSAEEKLIIDFPSQSQILMHDEMLFPLHFYVLFSQKRCSVDYFNKPEFPLSFIFSDKALEFWRVAKIQMLSNMY